MRLPKCPIPGSWQRWRSWCRVSAQRSPVSEGCGRALQQSPVEQTFGGGREHVRSRVLCTGRLSAEQHRVGIAAEGLDIALHPLEHGLDIENAVVAVGMTLSVERRMR